MFFIAGGFDTSSRTLTSITYILHKHPEFRVKLAEEIKRVINNDIDALTVDKLDEMEYLARFIKEALRFDLSVTGVFMMNVYKEFEAGGIHFKKGTEIQYNVHYINYNKEQWKEPTKFEPD